jgi:hypothetical protein
MFFTLEPLATEALGELRLLGWQPRQLDAWWPGVTDTPLVSLLLYLLLFDFVDAPSGFAPENGHSDRHCQADKCESGHREGRYQIGGMTDGSRNR